MTDEAALAAEIGGLVDGVRARIAAASARAGRDASRVTLVGVAKFQPAAAVRAAIGAGLRDVGENLPGELEARTGDLQGEHVRLHLIGQLHSSGPAAVPAIARADVLHAVTGTGLLREVVEARGGRPVDVFVQVDVTGAGPTAGVSPDAVGAVIDDVRAVAGVVLRGLMAMPPEAADPEAKRPWFAALRHAAQRCGVEELSMGTTDDFEVAVEEGATFVRVGRQVFGVRHGEVPPELRRHKEAWLARNPPRLGGVAG